MARVFAEDCRTGFGLGETAHEFAKFEIGERPVAGAELERVHRGLQTNQHTDGAGSHLGSHLQAFGVGLGKYLEQTHRLIGAATGLSQRDRQRTTRHLHHHPHGLDFVIEIGEV